MKGIIRILFGVVALTTFCGTVSAQTGKQRFTREQLAEVQAKHIAKEMAMDDATSQRFIDTFCQFQRDIWALGPRPKHPNDQMTDEETEQALKARFAHSQKILDLRQKYYVVYSEFLTQKQIRRVYEHHAYFHILRACRKNFPKGTDYCQHFRFTIPTFSPAPPGSDQSPTKVVPKSFQVRVHRNEQNTMQERRWNEDESRFFTERRRHTSAPPSGIHTQPGFQRRKQWLRKPFLEHPRRNPIEQECREKAGYGIDEIVRLDIDRGCAKQQVEGQEPAEQPLAAPPGHNHQDGRHTHVRTGEGGRGTFAYLLRAFHQAVEEAVLVARTGKKFLVVVKIIADGRKVALRHLVEADGREIELRAGHRDENIDKVVDEKRSDDDERHFLQQVVAMDEVPQDNDEHHGVIEEIAQVERLADPHLRQTTAEPDGGLAAKQTLLGRSKHMVEVQKQAVELEGVRIPIGKQRHLYHHPHEGTELAGRQPIKIHQQKSDKGYERTIPQHLGGMVHQVVENYNQNGSQQIVYQ